MSQRYRPPIALMLFQLGLWGSVVLIVGWFVLTPMLHDKAPRNEVIPPSAAPAAATE
ncbi:hypothetical protein [Devosia rhizoryzae]|uniref:Uncharacterized protein n=1 Tax=Devosia rhizoryzae TaxID=2774137 RepID=A0ABX7C763_9HYPH|nr:hypothetical protein [Devosia rhizoryzae]QQR40058.1 hypothetical protein JI748_03305 [Devosia rhizoryzae]